MPFVPQYSFYSIITNTTIKIPDYYYNDVLLRPQELDKMCCYEVKMHYEKIKIPKKKKTLLLGIIIMIMMMMMQVESVKVM